MAQNDARRVAAILLKTKAVTLSPKKPYKYASGLLGPIYCDNRLLLSYPSERSYVRDLFVERIMGEEVEPDVVCGIATAGISWAAYVSDALSMPMVYVRSDKKSHGKENKIEGNLVPGSKVAVLEDLVTTGGSSLAGVEGVRSAGSEVLACYSIFSYDTQIAKTSFDGASCKLVSLSSLPVLMSEARSQGLLSDDDESMLRDWHSDPAGWGKRMGYE